jgi:hypothetical protein
VDRELVLLLLVFIVAAVAIVMFLWYRKRHTQRLRERFGPEYDRTVDAIGNQRKAEHELISRAKRVEKLEIHPLAAEQKGRYTDAWKSTQARFVDEPSQAVNEADDLVKEVMAARGYPVGDFEQRTADISVHHPRVVGNYRIARDIAIKNRKGESTTEDLRQALVAYRELFVDLLEEETPVTKSKHRVVEEVHNDSRSKGAYRH